jgi:DNA-binding NtrC family response regulator
VRELRNVLERALVRCRGEELGARELFLPAGDEPPPYGGHAARSARPERSAAGAESKDERLSYPLGLPLDLGALEQLAIAEALRRVHGNRTHAARLLGIGLRTLRNKLRLYRQTGVDVEPAALAAGQVPPGADVTVPPPHGLSGRARPSQEERS